MIFASLSFSVLLFLRKKSIFRLQIFSHFSFSVFFASSLYQNQGSKRTRSVYAILSCLVCKICRQKIWSSIFFRNIMPVPDVHSKLGIFVKYRRFFLSNTILQSACRAQCECWRNMLLSSFFAPLITCTLCTCVNKTFEKRKKEKHTHRVYVEQRLDKETLEYY